jgi:predicted transcriptional regulator
MDHRTEAERFLLTTYDCLVQHPREPVSPTEVGVRLGLEYDRVHELLEELGAADLLWRTGNRQLLMDSRVMITDQGFTAIQELRKRRQRN